MQSTFISSYIITYTHSHRNLKILKDNLNQIFRDPRIQIIVVEMGRHAHLEHHDIRARYVHLDTDVYNLGWAFNIGAKYATSPNLFFGDFRFFPKLEVIHSVIQNYGDRQCIYLQNFLGKMTQEETDNRKPNMQLQTIESLNKGIIFYTKDGLLAVGGFDENVFNDEFWLMQEKKNQLVNTGKVNGNSTVEFFVDDLPLKSDLIEYSKKHWDRVSGIEQERLVSYTRSQYKKIGNRHKYQKEELMNP